MSFILSHSINVKVQRRCFKFILIMYFRLLILFIAWIIQKRSTRHMYISRIECNCRLFVLFSFLFFSRMISFFFKYWIHLWYYFSVLINRCWKSIEQKKKIQHIKCFIKKKKAKSQPCATWRLDAQLIYIYIYLTYVHLDAIIMWKCKHLLNQCNNCGVWPSLDQRLQEHDIHTHTHTRV